MFTRALVELEDSLSSRQLVSMQKKKKKKEKKEKTEWATNCVGELRSLSAGKKLSWTQKLTTILWIPRANFANVSYVIDPFRYQQSRCLQVPYQRYLDVRARKTLFLRGFNSDERCSIFGEAKIEDLNSQAQANAAQQLQQAENASSIEADFAAAAAADKGKGTADAAKEEEEDDGEEVDEEGLENKDIELVMAQVLLSLYTRKNKFQNANKNPPTIGQRFSKEGYKGAQGKR